MRATAAIWMAVCLAGPALAAQPEASNPDHTDAAVTEFRQYAIPGGTLEQVLNAFGRDSGVLLSYPSALTAGIASTGLHGSYSVAGGLAEILRNTGLHASQKEAAYVIETGSGDAVTGVDTHPLPVVSINARSVQNETEGSTSYTIATMDTANRLMLSPRATPQSVSVVTRAQMDDSNARTLDDISLMVTGLNLSLNSYERESVYSRGFPINFYLQDGMPFSSDPDSMGLATLAMYDRIEVLRGAAGILTGVGDPSGVINMVRKRPTAETQVSLTTSAGSWHDYRTELDASGSLNEARSLRGRAVLAWQNADTFMNNYQHRRLLAYGTMDADLSRDTMLSVGVSYNQEDNPGSSWYGLPASADGSFLPLSRTFNTAPDWTYWNKINTSVFAELTTRLAAGWTGRIKAQAIRDHSEALVTGTAASGSSDNLFTLNQVGQFDYVRVQKGLELQANGPFRLLGGEHEMILGASYRTREVRDAGNAPAAAYSYTFDALTWNGSGAPLPTDWVPSYTNVSYTRQTGFYDTARFRLAVPWSLMLGARVDWYEYAAFTNYGGVDTPTSYRADSRITPYFGMTYDLSKTYTLYGSWTSVFKPQTGVDASGRLLDPVTGSNSEIGIKGAYFDGALNLSAALFRIRQRNLPLTLDTSICQASSACYAESGEVESRGLELEIAGALSDAWQISAGLSMADARYLSTSDDGAAGTRYASDTQPARSLHLSTMYRLSGRFSQWRIGAALRTQSEIYGTQTPVVRQGGYTVVNLMAGWQAAKNIDVRLSVNNLFDKWYYQSVYNSVSGNTFGVPRNVTLAVKYNF